MNKIIELFGKRHQYDEPTQAIIESWHKTSLEIDALNAMKLTDGWKLLERKMREELKIRIREMLTSEMDERQRQKVKGNIETLLQVLGVVDTRNNQAILEEEVEKFIGEA
ncbi:hypothetical protein M1295_01435 [Patescibacteria group bacterium]|nr:hypothetical protein [Patescibacteria group bacterium]